MFVLNAARILLLKVPEPFHSCKLYLCLLYSDLERRKQTSLVASGFACSSMEEREFICLIDTSKSSK